MKVFVTILKWLGLCILVYPLLLLYAFFDSGGNIDKWFLLEILIIDVVVCLLLFLFQDFKLVKRIKNFKNKKQK